MTMRPSDWAIGNCAAGVAAAGARAAVWPGATTTAGLAAGTAPGRPGAAFAAGAVVAAGAAGGVPVEPAAHAAATRPTRATHNRPATRTCTKRDIASETPLSSHGFQIRYRGRVAIPVHDYHSELTNIQVQPQIRSRFRR